MTTNQLNTLYVKTATSVANNNGTTIDAANNINKSKQQVSVLNENIHPSENTISSKIKLVTYDGSNVSSPEIIVEQYFIKPLFKGIIKCTDVQNVFYLPLNNLYAIKFYAPDQYNPKVYNFAYAVPAKFDNTYLTGLKDYSLGISKNWLTAFVQYASSLPKNITQNSTTPSNNLTKSFSAAETIQKIQFQFSYWGSLSGVASKASTFAFEFMFYPGTTPTEPIIKSN